MFRPCTNHSFNDLSTICWSFVQLRNLNQTEGGLFAHVLTASPQTFSVVEQVGFWPQRDKEKIRFRLWIHWKKMWSCTFFKTAIYTRWEINMIFDWYLILFPVCFWDPLIYSYQFHYFTMISPYNITPGWHSFTWWHSIEFGRNCRPQNLAASFQIAVFGAYLAADIGSF